MSILSGFIKTKKYRKTDEGYKLESRWTSSQTVEMDDKSTLEEKAQDLSNKISDTSNSIVTYTSEDVSDENAASWTSVPALTSGMTHATFLQRVSQMFKNVRYIRRMLGTTDISSIGGGTVTGALSSLNSNLSRNNMLISLEYNPLDTMADIAFHAFRVAANDGDGVFAGIIIHGAAYKFDGFIINSGSDSLSGVVDISSYIIDAEPTKFSYSVVDGKVQNR